MSEPQPIRQTLRYRMTRWFVSKLARPVVSGTASDTLPKSPVYVLNNRSLSDIVVLDLVCETLDLPNPLATVTIEQNETHLEEARRFFFLNRPSGFWRRNTMRTYSERMVRLLECEAAPNDTTTLLPIAVVWGRAPTRENSTWRLLLSENWSTTSRLRRLFSLLLLRRDIVVHFGTPIPLTEVAETDVEQSVRVRRAARLLRVQLRNQRVATLGPDLSHRRTLVRQIVRARTVQQVIEQECKELPDKERDKAMRQLARRAEKYARTIASDMSYPTIRVLETLLTWFWNKLYDGVVFNGLEAVETTAKDHTLVYVPSHRSHLDYLLLSYLLFHRGLMLPHIAAGDNLNLPILGPILRRGGAFFMRRTFRDDALYQAVFSEYLYQVYRRGHSVEFFPEGGRSRTGRLLPVKTGLIRMTLHHHHRGLPKPLAFVPVYFGYEKLVEGASYLDELRGGSKSRESILDVFRGLRLIRQEFGSVTVNVGVPIQLTEWLDHHQLDPNQAATAQALGQEIAQRINAAADVNAVNLMALTVLNTPRLAISMEDLTAQLHCYRTLLRATGYQVTDRDEADCVMHAERLKLVQVEKHNWGDVVAVNPAAAVLLTWYRNNVAHTLALPSLLACLLRNRRRPTSLASLRIMVDQTYPYLARELSTDYKPETVVTVVNAMCSLGLVLRNGDGDYLPPDGGSAERQQLHLLAMVVMQTLERLYIIIRLLQEPIACESRRALQDGSHAVAQRLSRLYELNAPEFFDRRLFDGFVNQLISQNAVEEASDGKLHPGTVIHQVAKVAETVINAEFRFAVGRVWLHPDIHQNESSDP